MVLAALVQLLAPPSVDHPPESCEKGWVETRASYQLLQSIWHRELLCWHPGGKMGLPHLSPSGHELQASVTTGT